MTDQVSFVHERCGFSMYSVCLHVKDEYSFDVIMTTLIFLALHY